MKSAAHLQLLAPEEAFAFATQSKTPLQHYLSSTYTFDDKIPVVNACSRLRNSLHIFTKNPSVDWAEVSHHPLLLMTRIPDELGTGKPGLADFAEDHDFLALYRTLKPSMPALNKKQADTLLFRNRYGMRPHVFQEMTNDGVFDEILEDYFQKPSFYLPHINKTSLVERAWDLGIVGDVFVRQHMPELSWASSSFTEKYLKTFWHEPQGINSFLDDQQWRTLGKHYPHFALECLRGHYKSDHVFEPPPFTLLPGDLIKWREEQYNELIRFIKSHVTRLDLQNTIKSPQTGTGLRKI